MLRKLAAIILADVAGFSAMMEADEAGTLQRLKRNRRDVFDPCVLQYGGRVVNLMGDGALIDFSSVVFAVECAIALQVAMAHTEQDRAPEDRLRYRIGINLGDVIVEGDDIYGDGVNVAARLQTLAPAGGIALARSVRDQIDGKVSATFQDLGEHNVKNIRKPVHVFVVQPPAQETIVQRTEAAPRISICVLPFTNMNGESEQEYFSDGMTEDIITDLSKVSALWVVARNTAFTMKGKNVDIQQLARQFKVTHVLEGSVRKSGGHVRVSAQLIDSSGGHVWAERYDRNLNDIFAIQDEISQSVVSALKLKLLPAERKAIVLRRTNNSKAYDLYLLARQLSVIGSSGNRRRTNAIIRLCRRATELDPSYALPWALLAVTQTNSGFLDDQPVADKGMAAAERAIALDKTLAEAHAARAGILILKGLYEDALDEIATALRLDPDSYEVNCTAARWYYLTRQFAGAIRHWEKAAGLIDSEYMAAGMLISCYNALGDSDSARSAARRTLERAEKILAFEPDNLAAISQAVDSLAALDETTRAHELVERAMLLDPDNANMKYNFACTFVAYLKEHDRALDLLAEIFEQLGVEAVNWAKNDRDLDPIRDHPRFIAALAAAEPRPRQSELQPEAN